MATWRVRWLSYGPDFEVMICHPEKITRISEVELQGRGLCGMPLEKAFNVSTL